MANKTKLMHPHRTKCARPIKFALLNCAYLIDCLITIFTLGYFTSSYGPELLFSEWADDIDKG